MDYKYIEQLMERYWRCETSLEEESILRTFFSQKDVPAELEQYRPLFAYEQTGGDDCTLGDDFDEKILKMVGDNAGEKPRKCTLTARLMPLFKAAAVVAIVVTLGNAAQLSMQPKGENEDINYSSYKDTYSDPSVAYDKVSDALKLVSEGISQSQTADTVAGKTATGNIDSTKTE